MADPTYRLEGVIHTKEDLEDFEGPLTLILQLLSKNKIEIRDIQISQLTDQYLEYLHEMETMDLEIASEFVAMASYLVYIKTRMLLTEEKETSELEQLIQSLELLKGRELYARIRPMTEIFAERYKQGAGTFVKGPEPPPEIKEYVYSHEPSQLSEAMRRVLAREDKTLPVQTAVAVPRPIIYPISRKSDEILVSLTSSGTVSLKKLYRESRSRSELVATFVCLLELCRDGVIAITESDDDMLITRSGELSQEDEHGES